MNKHTGLGNKFNTGYIMGKCDNGRIVEVSLVKDAVGKTICAVMAEGLYADIQWLYDNYVTGVLNALYDNAINRHAMSDMATTYTKCYFGASNIPAIQIMSWAVQLRYTVLNPPISLPKGYLLMPYRAARTIQSYAGVYTDTRNCVFGLVNEATVCAMKPKLNPFAFNCDKVVKAIDSMKNDETDNMFVEYLNKNKCCEILDKANKAVNGNSGK